MRTIWLIFVSSLQRMRALAIGSLAGGLALCVLLIVVTRLLPSMDTPMRLGYINSDSSVVSADFESYMTEKLGIELVEGDEAWLEGELVDKHISAIVEVPAGFEQALLDGTEGALLATYMDDYANRAFLQSYLESYTGSLQALASYAQSDAGKFSDLLSEAREAEPAVSTIALDELLVQKESDWTVFLLLFGFFVLVSSLITIGVATIVFEDRLNNTYQRVQASGVAAAHYVIGVCVAGLLVAVIMILVFILFSIQQGLGVNIPMGPIFLMSILFALFCVGFALVCGLFCKTRNSCYWVILAVATVFCLLGGAYFPIEYSPQVMQQIAHITPHFWLMETIRQISTGQTDAWIMSSGILALFALLCFLVAGIRFASRQSKAL